MDNDLKDLQELQELKELNELEEQLNANPAFSNELGKKFEKAGQEYNNPKNQMDELKELENLGNPLSQPSLSPQERLLQINQEIIKLNNKLNNCKKRNDYMGEKTTQNEIQKFEEEKNQIYKKNPKLIPKPKLIQNNQPKSKEKPSYNLPDPEKIKQMDEFKLETQIHTINEMNSYMVLDNEMKLIQNKIYNYKAMNKNTQELEIKLESIHTIINLMKSKYESGLVNPKEYKKDMKNYVAYQEALYKHLKGFFDEKCEMMYRISQRIDITKREIEMTPEETELEEHPQNAKEESFNAPIENFMPDVNRFQKFEEQKQNKINIIPEESNKELINPVNNNPSVQLQNMQDGNYPSMNPEGFNTFTDPQTKGLNTNDLSNQNTNIGNIDQMEIMKDAPIEINQAQLEEVGRSINEYEQAVEYLKEVNFENQLQKMEKKKALIEKMKFCIQNGKSFDFTKVNIHLTPLEIIGIDEIERKKKFEEVINLLRQRVEIFKERATLLLEEFKKQPKNTRIKIDAKKMIEKAEESNAFLKHIKIIAENVWQPPPSFHMEKEDMTIEKINEDIPPNVLRISFFPDQKLQMKPNYYCSLSLDFEKSHILDKEFSCSQIQILPLQLDEKSIKFIDHSTLTLRIYLKSNSGHIDETQASVRLKDLAKNINLEQTIKNGNLYSYNIRCQINSSKSPCMEHYIKEMILFDYLPRPFKELENYLSTFKSDSDQSMPMIKEREKPKPTKAQKTKPIIEAQITQKCDPPLNINQGNLPGGIKIEDVEDPNNPGNLNSYAYLKYYMGELTKQISEYQKIGKIIPPELKAKYSQANKNFISIKSSVENQKLNQEQYKNFLNTQIAKDKILLKYLVENKQETKAEIVKKRIKMITEEIIAMN